MPEDNRPIVDHDHEEEHMPEAAAAPGANPETLYALAGAQDIGEYARIAAGTDGPTRTAAAIGLFRSGGLEEPEAIAARSGRLEALIAAGIDPDAEDGSRHRLRLVHHVARHGTVADVEALAGAGADMRAVTNKGRSALFAALGHNPDPAVARHLAAAHGLGMEQSAPQDGRAPSNQRASWRAFCRWQRNPEVGRAAIEMDPEIFERRDSYNHSVHHVAARFGRLENIGVLLEATPREELAARLNEPTGRNGRTALIYAAGRNPDPEVLRRLGSVPGVDLAARTRNNWTALDLAAGWNNPDVVAAAEGLGIGSGAPYADGDTYRKIPCGGRDLGWVLATRYGAEPNPAIGTVADRMRDCEARALDGGDGRDPGGQDFGQAREAGAGPQAPAGRQAAEEEPDL